MEGFWSSSCQALADGSDFIVGPLTRDEVATVAAGADGRASVLALNFLTDASLRTLPVAIANFQGVHATDWGLVFAGSLTQVIPTVILFVFFQRYFVQGLTTGAVRG